MNHKLTPKSQALAYRIWCYANPREWNVTIPELAEHLDANRYKVQLTLRHAGWLGRVRGVSAGFGSGNRFERGGLILRGEEERYVIHAITGFPV
ncbi:MAG: Rrf2 family transcriptional regulator [Paracoccaceae bacterium]|nr:Rrf2 family transcriptional regulator [Paracoccaceae bacterium]